MDTTAVIYASKLGKVKNVGKYIADKLGADSFDLKKQTMINMSEYNRIIFGTGIQSGKPFKPMMEFLEKNKEVLGKKKLSMFVCGKLDAEKGAAQFEESIDGFKISDIVFFSGKGEKNEEDIEVDVDSFIEKLRV